MGEVEIEIRADGTVVVSTHGVKGKTCLKYTEFVQQMLGREESRQLTDEFYEPDTRVQLQERQRLGR